jgi:isocitrate dehydrogenase kinase/phosphatase
MTSQQITDNLNIVQLHDRVTFLRMADHLDFDDYRLIDRLKREMATLSQTYEEQYGEAPLIDACRYLDDVRALRKKLQEMLV